MQAALNPALAAALTLDRAAQVGEFAPMTKEGTPTVVGGLMQKVMPPAVPDVVQQAGLGGQIQAMQMQEAQKAVMNQAMQQAKGPAGLEGLNPQMGGFAEGGIVGYAPGGTAAGMLDPEQYALEIEMMNAEAEARRAARARRDEAERLAFLETAAPEVAARLKAQQAPVAQPAAPEVAVRQERPPAPPPQLPPAAAPSGGGVNLSGIEALMNKQREIIGSMKGPSTPEDAIAYEQRRRPAFDAYLRSQGIDPDAFTKRAEEDKALMEQQRGLLRERMEREQGKDTFLSRAGAALRGFQQFQGQGLGQGMMSAYDNLARQVASGERTMDQLRDFEIKLNELDINRRRSLEDAKRATVEGRVKDAEQALNNANAFSNEIKKLTAATYTTQVQQTVEMEKASAARDATRAGREGQEFARLQGIASTYEGRKAETLRKLDDDFNKQNDILLKSAQAMGRDKMPPAMRQSLETAEAAHRANRAAVAQQFDERLAMINQRLYPGVDFSVGRAAPSAAPMYAVNPKTDERIMSTDGGKNWQSAR